MKLMHIGDLHLGKSLGDFDLINDQKFILDEILRDIERKNVDGLLIAGDVYDRAVPSEEAVRLLDYFLNRLSEMGTSVFIISGNHDSDDRLNFGRKFFTDRNIFISSVFDGHLEKRTISKDGVEADVYLMPFIKASVVRRFFPDAGIETYEDAVRTVIADASPDPDRINILLAHQFVTGGDDPVLSGSEGIGTLNVGTVEKINWKCFDKFNYVALGHIHSPQKVGREEVRYSGSILKYSLSEVNSIKSAPVITIDRNGVSDISFLNLSPERDLRHIRGKLCEIVNPDDVHDESDFIYATLTDEDYIENAISILRQVYPNTVKLDYDNSHTRSLETVDIANVSNAVPFDELISDFFKKMYGKEISEEEMSVMRDAAREAGIINEAD